ncbi:hypothetical protein [Sorangium sp. So ce1024]|uniref:hypothetical protein n=1 Tax=unclassified Sorangium TaxID=2621164 RepID=UPI003F029B0C
MFELMIAHEDDVTSDRPRATSDRARLTICITGQIQAGSAARRAFPVACACQYYIRPAWIGAGANLFNVHLVDQA